MFGLSFAAPSGAGATTETRYDISEFCLANYNEQCYGEVDESRYPRLIITTN